MGLRPWELGQLTVYEYERMIEAWEKEDQRLLKREASFTASLMNATGNFKEPMTADSLMYGPRKHELDEEKLRERAQQRRDERLRTRKQRGQHAR